MKSHRSYLGLVDTKTVQHMSVPKMDTLRNYLNTDFVAKDSLIEGCFSYIVDTGCSCSCSPHLEDFETLKTLKAPITLKGVAGEAHCTQAGIIKVQTITAKGELVTLRTPGYYNPHQSVRLFSPQAHFWLMPKKKGVLNMSWAKTCLDLPDVGKLPLVIDRTTFMPILSCFHDVEKVLQTIANPCVTDEVNPHLSPRSKLLLKLHYKLGQVVWYSGSHGCWQGY